MIGVIISIFIELNTALFSQIWQGNLESLRLLSGENPMLTLLVTLGLMTVQNMFTVIPLILLITFNITLFGFFYGYLWSWVTSVIAAMIVFFGVRYFFQDYILEKMGPKMKEKAEENGFKYVFVGRIFPFVPTSIINIAAGVSSIRFKHFLVATTIGNLLYFFLLSLIPLGLLSIEIDQYVFALIALTIIAYVLVKKYVKKKNMESIEGNEG